MFCSMPRFRGIVALAYAAQYLFLSYEWYAELHEMRAGKAHYDH